MGIASAASNIVAGMLVKHAGYDLVFRVLSMIAFIAFLSPDSHSRDASDRENSQGSIMRMIITIDFLPRPLLWRDGLRARRFDGAENGAAHFVKLYSGLLLAVTFLFVKSAAWPAESQFGFTYTTYLLPKNEKEIEQWLNGVRRTSRTTLPVGGAHGF